MAELSCKGLAKSFGETAVLSDVDLVVPQGTLTAILGASGSGKTTLLRLLIGFVAPDKGVVSIGGNVVSDAVRLHVPPNERAIGYVAQEGALFPHLTVAENVGFGLPRSERKRSARIDEALDLVGLDRLHANKQPHQLSGGEQRRVALARALAPRPACVLLDEPFSGLDPALRSETRVAVLEAMTAVGATGVLVTHDQAEALSMGREVGVLRAGRLVQTAAPAALYWTPVDLDVAQFVGEGVVLSGVARSGSVLCDLGMLPVRGTTLEGPVQVMIRPEQIRLDRGNTPATHDNGVAARVVDRTFFGPDTVLRMELADGSGTAVIARAYGDIAEEPGAEVMLVVDGPVAVYRPPAGATP